MTSQEIATILGGFGVAFLSLLGLLSTNKKENLHKTIDTLEKTNEDRRLEIEQLKTEIKEQDKVIDELKNEILKLKQEMIEMRGGKQYGI